MKAILLAAGKGTRLQPLTNTTPKPLVEINGLPIIERQIQYLIKKGIIEIIVVTGYLKDHFTYLVHKYGVKLVHNPNYDQYNNLYTMYLVREYLQDAYVIEGDIYMNSNIFSTDLIHSTYFSPMKYDFQNEWILQLDQYNNLTDIIIGSIPGSYIMCGISYWNKEDGLFLQQKLEEYISNLAFRDKYWDHIIKENLAHFTIQVCKLKESDLYEIDSLEDLNQLLNRISD